MTTDDDVTAGTRTALARLMTEFFRAVSFQPGEAPPYELLHDLFVAGGRLIRNSGEVPEITTVEEFIAPRQQMVDSGELSEFEETEEHEITEIFGNIAHRLSTYHKRGRTSGVAFAAPGRHLDAVRPDAGGMEDELHGLGRRTAGAQRSPALTASAPRSPARPPPRPRSSRTATDTASASRRCIACGDR